MEPGSIVQLIVLFFLLILSGLFSSAETALTTVNRNKLRAMSEEGHKRAGKVLKMTEDSSKLLSTVLVGNNIVNLSASALATTLCTELFGSKFVGLATGILTFLILIFGEITPKSLATLYSLQLSLFYAYPIAFLMFIFTPVIWILNKLSYLIFKLFRIDPNHNPNQMTESELRTIVDVSHEEGVIEPEEKKMITNVVDFGDALSKDIMIPRADMVCADVNSTYEEMIEILNSENYSRIPIYEESKDHIIGILHVKDLFMYRERYGTEALDVRKIMRKPLFVYEYQKTARIFADMKTSSASVCIVLDEYGITAGLITMEDLVEEIVGDIRDEYDEAEKDLIRTIGENHYNIDAAVKLDDLNDAIGTTFQSEHYDSLGGYVIELLDRLPDAGDKVEEDGILFKVLKMNKNRIDRIELRLPEPQENEEETMEKPEEEK